MLFIFNIQLNVVKNRSKYDNLNRENSRLWKIIIQAYTLYEETRDTDRPFEPQKKISRRISIRSDLWCGVAGATCILGLRTPV